MVIPLKAGGAVSQYRFVKITAADTASVATAATDIVFGITQTAATAANDPLDVATMGGVTFVEAGAAITAGARLTADATGRAVTAAPAAGTNNGVGARAIQAAAAAGDIIRVFVSLETFQG